MSDNAREESKKQFGQEEYERVHELVYEYQNGSSEAAEELIERFSKFFTKYIALIKFGIYDLSYAPTRNFIKLFAQDSNDKKLINPYFKDTASSKRVSSNVVNLIQRLFENSSVDDIKQDLKIIFLNMCNKYKDTKPSFHNYIYKTFHFNAYRYFEKMTRDPVARGHIYEQHKMQMGCENESLETDIFDVLPDENSYIENNQTIHDLNLYYESDSNVLFKSESNSIYDTDFLDTNWINGYTCNELFSCLDPSERRILEMWYIENKTDIDIAKEFGVCRGTINRKRNVAKEKLQANLKRG